MEKRDNEDPMKVAKGVRDTANQNGAVLLDIEQGLCFSINPVGAKIWGMIKEERSIDEIADALEQEFRLPRSQLLTDISEFVKQLEDMRLIGERSRHPTKKGLLSRLIHRSA